MRQNIIPFNKAHAQVKVSPKLDKNGLMTGELDEDSQLYLSQNFQFLRTILSQDGHSTPGRSNSDLTTLSQPSYTGRHAYNMDTENAMVNVEGLYKNITPNSPYSPSNVLNPNRFEWYVGTGNQLFGSVNGNLYQAILGDANGNNIFFSTDGTFLTVNLNGTPWLIPLSVIGIQFLSFDGTYLYITISGSPFKIQILPP